jgi:hypothetical protein
MLPNRVPSQRAASDAASFTDRWGSRPYHMYSLSTAAITILLLIGSYQLWRRTRLPGPLPPGPKGLPWIGNALQLRNKRWLLSPSCKEKYGTTYVPGLLLSILTLVP